MRMGGVDKGLMPLGARTMVEQVIERLQPQVGRIVLNANQNAARYAALGYPVHGDAMPDFAGPLAGLQTGLLHCTTPYLVTAPCDSPFFPLDLVARLAQALHANASDIAVAVTGEGATRQPHPVFCLVSITVLPHLTHYLQNGGRKFERWYSTLKTTEVHFADEKAFQNINTLEELKMTV
jgi:molybdopterin-guanine dinucleotide biosynthesis protein A